MSNSKQASFLSDLSFSAVVAGFVAMMVGHALLGAIGTSLQGGNGGYRVS